jgi:Dna[CI] antecedent, DciA
MATEPIAKLLGENPEVRPLAERLQQIKRLQKRYRTLVPDNFGEASRVCAIDGTTVVVCAASGPVAAALRHLAPRILEGLRGVRKSPKNAWDQELNSIRIEVQVTRSQPPVPVKPRGNMPREQLDRLADRLADSPLKETLRRMARDDQTIKRTRSKT